jgi:hypothetical protein
MATNAYDVDPARDAKITSAIAGIAVFLWGAPK